MHGVPGVPLLPWLQDSIPITGLWLCLRNHTCMLCCIYNTAIFAYSVFLERRLAGRLPHFLLGCTHQKSVSFLMRWHEIWPQWGTRKTAASFHWCYQVANAQASKSAINKWITNYGDDLNRSDKSWQWVWSLHVCFFCSSIVNHSSGHQSAHCSSCMWGLSADVKSDFRGAAFLIWTIGCFPSGPRREADQPQPLCIRNLMAFSGEL